MVEVASPVHSVEARRRLGAFRRHRAAWARAVRSSALFMTAFGRCPPAPRVAGCSTFDASVDGVTTGELRSKTAIASLRPVPSDFAFTAG